MHEKRDMAKAHDARVTELLAANNIMVEKRRELACENYKLRTGIGEMTERRAA